ncbi:MAG: hypothetical protein U0232_05940 [Thermomicrobiales bacterium]
MAAPRPGRPGHQRRVRRPRRHAERYAREWLSAMACHGYLAYDDGTKQFRLPPEHAFVLADPDSPFYLASTFPMLQPYYANLDLLTEAFKTGGGVPQPGPRRDLDAPRALHPHRLSQQLRAGLDPRDAQVDAPSGRVARSPTSAAATASRSSSSPRVPTSILAGFTPTPGHRGVANYTPAPPVSPGLVRVMGAYGRNPGRIPAFTT